MAVPSCVQNRVSNRVDNFDLFVRTHGGLTMQIAAQAHHHQLGTTEAWRSHAPADTTPEEIYGKNGSMSHLFNEPFATRADLQDALAQNHGGGVQMEVIEALAALCGPRLYDDAAQVESPL